MCFEIEYQLLKLIEYENFLCILFNISVYMLECILRINLAILVENIKICQNLLDSDG